MSKAITRLLRHDQSVPRGSDGAIHYSDIIGECRMQKFDASQWLLEDWISTLATGGERRRYFTIARIQTLPNQFLYLEAIRRHSGESALDPAPQDSIPIPKGFTEYIHHVGNASELNSFFRNGLIPEGKSLKRGRQAVFFTVTCSRFSTTHCLQLALCRQIHLTRDFFLYIFDFVHTSHCCSRCRSVCLTKSLMHMSSHV